MNINDFFDYHYYRVAKFYYKRDGAEATTALISISAVQGWLIINFLIFLKEFFFNNEKLKYGWVYFILIMIGVILYNKKRYKKRYVELRNKWSNETKEKKILKGIIIILTIIFAWSLLFINMIILNNFR